MAPTEDERDGTSMRRRARRVLEDEPPLPSLAPSSPLPPLDLDEAEAHPHPLDGLSFRLRNGLELVQGSAHL